MRPPAEVTRLPNAAPPPRLKRPRLRRRLALQRQLRRRRCRCLPASTRSRSRSGAASPAPRAASPSCCSWPTASRRRRKRGRRRPGCGDTRLRYQAVTATKLTRSNCSRSNAGPEGDLSVSQSLRFASLTLASVFAAALGMSAQGQGGPPPAPPKPGQLAPEYFKNIKVLTKVPADQLRTQMEYFTASLGVQCNFCHVQGQFDSDENPRKDRARKMMQMVDRFNDSPSNDITVTCATCHHGRVPPERTPTLAVNMTQAEADAAAAARAARGGGPGGGGQGRGPGG